MLCVTSHCDLYATETKIFRRLLWMDRDGSFYSSSLSEKIFQNVYPSRTLTKRIGQEEKVGFKALDDTLHHRVFRQLCSWVATLNVRPLFAPNRMSQIERHISHLSSECINLTALL